MTLYCVSITEQTTGKCNLFVLYNKIEKIPELNTGAALQGGCGGVEHPPTRHQLGKSLTSVGKTGLAKDNH